MKTKHVIKMHVIYDWITPIVKPQVKRVVLSRVSCFPDITTVSAARAETRANRAAPRCPQAAGLAEPGGSAAHPSPARGSTDTEI